MSDPALSMTLDDLRFVALIDRRLDDAARERERQPCPGCCDPCDQCDSDATD